MVDQPIPVTLLKTSHHRWLQILVVWVASASSAIAAIASPDLQTPAPPQPGVQWIRVAVVQNQPQIDLAIHGRFRIVALQTAEALREGEQLPTIAVRAMPRGIAIGPDLLPLVGLRIEPGQDATIHLNGQRLRGTLDIVRQTNETLLVVNTVGLEEYLQGVLSKEAPYYWPAESLRAIAIAARTYALFQRLSKSSVEYDVTSTVLSQEYGGKTAEKRRTSRAVKDTRGLILTYRGQVFPAFYHSTCGGLTQDGSVMGPYHLEPLKGGVACSFCAASPFYRWERRFTTADVGWALKQKGFRSVGGVDDVRVVRRTPMGRVEKIEIQGLLRSVILSGYDFRALFGFDRLRSTAFTVERLGQGLILHGRGWGHGVGLCQWGTAELARRGLSAQEILAFYYPGAEVVRLGDAPLQPIVVQGGLN